VLAHCLDTTLRLLHPVVPFITEELWQKLPGRAHAEILAAAAWPLVRSELIDERAENEFKLVQDAITASRSIRAEYKVPPKERTVFYINPGTSHARATLNSALPVIIVMSGSANAFLQPPPPNTPGGHAVLSDGTTAFVQLEGTIDINQECTRLSSERQRLDKQLTGLTAKLSNENFVSRAPAEVVAREREKEREWRFQRDVLDGKLKSLGCS
jgi:valyl-tRNA synthetase